MSERKSTCCDSKITGRKVEIIIKQIVLLIPAGVDFSLTIYIK